MPFLRLLPVFYILAFYTILYLQSLKTLLINGSTEIEFLQKVQITALQLQNLIVFEYAG